MPNFNCDPNVDTAGLVDLSYGWEGCTSIESFPPKDFNSWRCRRRCEAIASSKGLDRPH